MALRSIPLRKRFRISRPPQPRDWMCVAKTCGLRILSPSTEVITSPTKTPARLAAMRERGYRLFDSLDSDAGKRLDSRVVSAYFIGLMGSSAPRVGASGQRRGGLPP